MSVRPDHFLSEQFRQTRRQLRGLLLKVWGGGLLAVMIGFAIAWFFVQPAPPRTITILTGSRQGAYYQFALAYAADLSRHGITLNLRATAGSVENYRLLRSDSSVDLAIVQGGTAPREALDDDHMEALASLYFEPVWVFYRSDQTFTDLRQLRGGKISIGRAGSGTESIARTLLRENGIDESSDTRFVHAGGDDAVRRLQSGQIDAAFLCCRSTPRWSRR